MRCHVTWTIVAQWTFGSKSLCSQETVLSGVLNSCFEFLKTGRKERRTRFHLPCGYLLVQECPHLSVHRIGPTGLGRGLPALRLLLWRPAQVQLLLPCPGAPAPSAKASFLATLGHPSEAFSPLPCSSSVTLKILLFLLPSPQVLSLPKNLTDARVLIMN